MPPQTSTRPRVLLLMFTRTYRAKAFVQAAARLGVEVTVGTERDQVLAPLSPGAYVTFDPRHPKVATQQIVDFARQYPIHAVVGVDDDTSVLAAMVAAALGLPHNSVDAVKATRYKDVLRLALSEAAGNLLQPEFEVVRMDEDPRLVAERLTYPVVLKPLSLSASRGVIRADNPEGFVTAFQEVIEIVREASEDLALAPGDPAREQLLVESFIPGREFALEGLLVDGQLTPLALFDKPDPLDGPYFEETIYLTPSRLPAETQAAIAEATAAAATAIGLREGPVHAEARVNEHGVWIVEVAARSIGGFCSNALRFGTAADTSLEEIILRQAARRDLGPLQRERQPSGVMMIPIPKGGTLCGVRGLDEARRVAGVEEVTISIPIGGRVVPLPRADRYLGFIFARAETPAAVEQALREAHARLTFEIT